MGVLILLLHDLKTSGPVLHHGLVTRSLFSANRWLKGVKAYRFAWYLMLLSANHASSSQGHMCNLASKLQVMLVTTWISSLYFMEKSKLNEIVHFCFWFGSKLAVAQ